MKWNCTTVKDVYNLYYLWIDNEIKAKMFYVGKKLYVFDLNGKRFTRSIIAMRDLRKALAEIDPSILYFHSDNHDDQYSK